MSKLSYFQNDWNDAPVKTSSSVPPDGTYDVFIENVSYSETDKDGFESDPQFVYNLRIRGGEYDQTTFKKFTTIRTAKNLSFLKGELTKLGLTVPENIEDIPDVFLNARGSLIEITIKTRKYNDKDYQDIYINKLIGKEAEAFGGDGNDEIPF